MQAAQFSIKQQELIENDILCLFLDFQKRSVWFALSALSSLSVLSELSDSVCVPVYTFCLHCLYYLILANKKMYDFPGDLALFDMSIFQLMLRCSK